MFPEVPSNAFPDFKRMCPLEPALAVPDIIRTSPLVPAIPAFAEPSVSAPLVVLTL